MACDCPDITNCDCPYGEIDALCVQYNGEDLTNINVETGDYLHYILEELNNFVFTETIFTPNSTDSIVATSGGTKGHSPFFSVRIDPDTDNAITVSGSGLFVDESLVGDGKVKVDLADPKDYLEDQMAGATDANNIVTITVTNVAGVLYMVPSVDVTALISYIETHHYDWLCEIASSCVPTPGTTTTSTTSTTAPVGTECERYLLINPTGGTVVANYMQCDNHVYTTVNVNAYEGIPQCAVENSVYFDDCPTCEVILAGSCDIEFTTTTTSTTTSTTTTTTSTLPRGDIFIENNGPGTNTTIEDVTPSIEYSIVAGSFPIAKGEVVQGVHGDGTSVQFAVDIAGPGPGALKLFINAVEQECITIGGTGVYTFAAISYVASDVLAIELIEAEC
jgi:hypothetical protein